MAYFRVYKIEEGKECGTQWGCPDLAARTCRHRSDSGDFICKLTSAQAREGCDIARRNYPKNRYYIKRFEDGEPNVQV